MESRPLLVLVPSGAAERTRDTSLVRARTPQLDRLAARAERLRVRTTPLGLAAGTEVGLPTMLGMRITTQPGRGHVDAAALGVPPLDGAAAWRVDLLDGGSPWLAEVPERLAARMTDAVGAPIEHVRGHRFVLSGPAGWGDGPDAVRGVRSARRRGAWRRRLAPLRRVLPRGVEPVVWGAADAPRWEAPAGRRIVVVASDASPAAGVARVAGLELRTPREPGGHALAELTALTALAERELAAADAPVVVVHSHHADDAAHGRRGADKVALLGAFDRLVTGPLVDVARRRHAGVWWCPDHAADPGSGAHLADPVPALWTADAADARSTRLRPLDEHDLRYAPVADGRTLLASLLRMQERRAA